MDDFIYPEAIKNLLITTDNVVIPELGFYKIKENENLKQSLKKEQDLIKENFQYFNFMSTMLGKDKANKLNNFKLFGYTKNFKNDIKGYSNAYRKMYEICQNYNFVPKTKNIIHLDLCSFPGSFVFATHDFIKTKRQNTNYQFYFQSYVKGKEDKEKFFEDRYGLAKKYKDRFLIKNNGDISNLNEINYLREKLKNKCNIITSDCGLESKISDDYVREKQMTKTFLGQFIAGMGAIKKNGNFVMKYYHFYSIFNVSLIYLMGLLFKNVYLIKPASSRQFTGKEIYIMAIGYKNNLTDKDFEDLKNILTNFNEEDLNKSIINEKQIEKDLFDNIISELVKYYDYKIERTYLKYKKVDDYIDIKWEDNYKEYLKRKIKLSKMSVEIEEKYLIKYMKEINYIKLKKEEEL